MDKCYTCAHGAADPDGFYCAAKESLLLSAYGLSPRAARAADGPCGPDATLYVACRCEEPYCPRHGVPTPRRVPAPTSNVTVAVAGLHTAVEGEA